MSYTRPVGDNVFRFGEDVFTSDDLTESASVETNSEDWTTVARQDLGQGEAAAFGRGETTNPLSAEGFIYFDAKAASDSDGDGVNDDLQGHLRIVAMNPNNEVVGEISRHNLDNVRSGSASASDRQDRQPYSRKRVKDGKAEVGWPYKIGYQIRVTDSYSNDTTFSLSASTLRVDGYKGTVQG